LISDDDPRFAINLDETGFKAFESVRSKGAKVVVSTAFNGKPVYEEVTGSHFVSALVASTLTDDV
jgi:hypothetical protein